MTEKPASGGRIVVALEGRMNDFSLSIRLDAPASGVTAIYGPSGSGKSTVLRVIAGLSRFADCRVTVGDEVWQSGDVFAPPHKRAVGYVFQDARLFPHLGVRENLLFGLKRASPPHLIAFDDVVELLGVSALLDRDVRRLSGGERQRVAIGRALLSQPRLLMMDEPLSALDPQSRSDILPYLKSLHRSLSIPMLYVSHDMAEVERLADWLVLIRNGRVAASGMLSDIQSDAGLPFALRPDAGVTLDARVLSHDKAYGLAELEVPGGRFWLPSPAGEGGATHRIQIAASDVSLALEPPTGTTIVNCLTARLVSLIPADPVQMVVVLTLGGEGSGARVLARVTRRSADALGLTPGMTVCALVKGVALVDSLGAAAPQDIALTHG